MLILVEDTCLDRTVLREIHNTRNSYYCSCQPFWSAILKITSSSPKLSLQVLQSFFWFSITIGYEIFIILYEQPLM